MQSSKKSKFGIFIIFMLMFLSPFIENTRGIFIPIFKEDFSVSNTVISTMITVVSLLGMGVTLLGGAITEKIGQKKTIFLGRYYNISIWLLCLVCAWDIWCSFSVVYILQVEFNTSQSPTNSDII